MLARDRSMEDPQKPRRPRQPRPWLRPWWDRTGLAWDDWRSERPTYCNVCGMELPPTYDPADSQECPGCGTFRS